MEIKISQIIISINYKIDLLVKMFAQIILYLKQNSWNGNFLRIATDLFDKPPLSPRICSGLSVGQARNKSMRKILKWRRGVMLYQHPNNVLLITTKILSVCPKHR